VLEAAKESGNQDRIDSAARSVIRALETQESKQERIGRSIRPEVSQPYARGSFIETGSHICIEPSLQTSVEEPKVCYRDW
jgi:hypothetical protein